MFENLGVGDKFTRGWDHKSPVPIPFNLVLSSFKVSFIPEWKTIILPSKNRLTELVILDCHKTVLHSGMKDTLNELRTKYWVPRGRSRVRSIIHSCLLCRKLGCKTFQTLPTAPLPDFRVSMSYPLANTGVDYLGPLFVYPSIARKG